MTNYDIPLSSIYEEGGGKRVLIQNGRVCIVDRTGDTPHDYMSFDRAEIPKLIEILIAQMATENQHDRLGEKYEEYQEG